MQRLSIVDTHPELLKEWDYEKNREQGYVPEKFSKGSSKNKVWWKCSLGHSWATFISSRIRGDGCPYCANKRVWIGFNDLESRYPEIAREWDYEKNDDSPLDIVFGADKKVFWKCSLGHCWQASPKRRTQNGNGCPVCDGKKVVKGFNDFATSFPKLVTEWNYDKNNGLLPEQFAQFSNKEVWWKCEYGHEWPMVIALRSRRKYGCPICSGNRVLKGYNDLNTKYPEIAKEWNYEKNDNLKPTDVTSGSKLSVWWKCNNGHTWKAVVSNRTLHKSGCPYCFSSSQTSFSEQAVYYFIKRDSEYDVLNRYKVVIGEKEIEVDVFIPDIFTGIEYDGIYWHKNKVESDTKKGIELDRIGIKLLRIKESTKNTIEGNIIYYNAKKDTYKNLSWAISRLEKLLGLRSKPVNVEESMIAISELCNFTALNNSLATRFPLIASEWNYERNKGLQPDQFSNGSSKKVWWRCSLGHEWQESIVARTNDKLGCPYCSGHRVLAGFNDLKTKCPDLINEWDYEKNVDVNPTDFTKGSHKKVWWTCRFGHKWQAVIKNRVNGAGCPECAKKHVKVYFKDGTSVVFDNCSICAEKFKISVSAIREFAHKNDIVGKGSKLYKLFGIVRIVYIVL